DQSRAAVTGPDHINHVEIVLFDQTIEVDIDKIEAGGCAPMSKQAWFDVLKYERRFEQRIILQIDLADREIVCGAPIGVHLSQQIGREGGANRGVFGLAHGPVPDGCKNGWPGGTPSAMFIADKIRATISRGCG